MSSVMISGLWSSAFYEGQFCTCYLDRVWFVLSSSLSSHSIRTKSHAAVARSTFASQNVENTSAQSNFCSSYVESWHAAVARSRFASENVQNTLGPDRFFKFRCRKIARRCGANHICKSNCAKYDMFGPLFEVSMSKNRTPLWREAHLQVKILKNWGVRTTCCSSDVEKLV